MPNTDSKNKKIRQIWQIMPVMMLVEFITTNSRKIVEANTRPIVQANFFGAAPTYSGVCLPTNKRPIINEGEYLGLMNVRIMKSIRKMVLTNLIMKKSSLKMTSIQARNIKKYSIPAEALISRSFKTGMLYPSTISPNCFTFFIFSPCCDRFWRRQAAYAYLGF